MTITSKECTHCNGNGWIEEVPGVKDSETECEWCDGDGREMVFGTHEEFKLWGMVKDLQQKVKELRP
jgi:hypothetical protein